MAMFLDDRKNSGGKLISSFLFFFLIITAIQYPAWKSSYDNWRTNTRATPSQVNNKEIIVARSEGDTGLKGHIFQNLFTQDARTAGRSPDELSIGFSQPVILKGFLISVDCWKSTRLVEFAAGINQKPAYSTHNDNNMLFHVSFATNRDAGKIDEHTWFPEGIPLNSGDRVNIGAWIQNSSSKEQSVSPEIILYYSWTQTPVETAKPRKQAHLTEEPTPAIQ
jgi:hypothetical protein